MYYAGKVQSDNSLDASLDKSDPAYIAYEQYLDQFHSDEVTYILYRVPDRPHGPFNYEAMQQIASLTEALENEVPFVREVTSLTNVEFIRAEGDDITIDANHPMAGMTLHFEVEIVDVREGTEQEIEHGHVHQDGADH